MTKFNSKRNNVYLHDNMVFKEHKSSKAASLEAEALTSLIQKGVAVPEVIKVESNVLCLEYIEGTPLPDFLLKQETVSKCSKAADDIVNWFESYYNAVNYSATSEIRGDVNGRNFIITNNGIVGVDFEDHVYGRMETDLGKLLAYIATYSYDDTCMQKTMENMLTESMIKRFSLSEDMLLADKTKEMKAIIEHREQKCVKYYQIMI